MGVTVYHISPYTFLMGVLWFSAFALLSLVMRKLRYPVKFSIMPLAILLIFSLLRVFIFIPIPDTILILSEVIYPAIVNFARYEIISSLSILNVLVFVWIAVAVVLKTKKILRYRKHYRAVKILTECCPRDAKAETMLAAIDDSKKPIYVYRTHGELIFTAGFKPVIFVPRDIELSDYDLNLVLRHEWKHIRDRDYIATLIVNIICAAFWWNPAVYVLRSNVSFAQELKCDYFAAKNNDHYSDSINRLAKLLGAQDDTALGHAFINKRNETIDRRKSLAIHEASRSKRALTNVCFFFAAGALFVSSYMFVVQPNFQVPPDVDVVYDISPSGFIAPVECLDSADVFKAIENFIVDNGDGTFSLFIDGQLVQGDGEISLEMFAVLPMRERVDD